MLTRNLLLIGARRDRQSAAASRCSQLQRQLAAFVALLVAGSMPEQAAADDWPRWRGPEVNGISAEKGFLTAWPQAGPKQLWRAKVGVGYSTVSVSEGRLYTMGNTDETDHVYCLDANTGKELWQHSYPCSAKDPNQRLGTRATPTVDGKLAYTVSRDGHLFCLNTADGKVAWSKSYSKDFGGKVPTWGFSGSALVEGNMLIVEPGGPRASLVALDKASGGVIWRAGDDPASYSSPIAYTYAGQRCVAVFTAKGLVSRRVADGKELWRHPWKTSWDVNAATPIVLGDKLFISSGYNSGCALIQFSSNPIKVLWQNKNMCNHVNSCVFWRGHVYGFDESRLRCLDFQTGRVKWTERSPGKGSLMMADGKLVVYSDQGRVAIAEASSERYKELSGAQVLEGRDTWAPPVLANGKLYCRSQEDLVCLDVQGK